MSKKEVVGSMSEWSGTLKDIFRQIDDGSLTRSMLHDVSERRNPFPEQEKTGIGVVPGDLLNGGVTFSVPLIPDTKLFLEEMAEFYGKVYDIVKLPSVKLPDPCLGFCWGLIMVPGITIEQDLAGCKKNYRIWRWTNDDLDILTKGRHTRDTSVAPYSIWLRDRVEADEEWKSKSYNDLIRLGVSGITLPERIRLERWFFWKTKEHLDIQNVTLCSGSLCDGGGVPRVGWGGGWMFVCWDYPDGADDYLRSRQAVS